jgi:hypothetical protein
MQVKVWPSKYELQSAKKAMEEAKKAAAKNRN